MCKSGRVKWVSVRTSERLEEFCVENPDSG
jgi:hypothetical protein